MNIFVIPVKQRIFYILGLNSAQSNEFLKMSGHVTKSEPGSKTDSCGAK
jgi:hypothetical protein